MLIYNGCGFVLIIMGVVCVNYDGWGIVLFGCFAWAVRIIFYIFCSEI